MAGTSKELSTPGFDSASWMDATVPGTVLTTMVDQGLYPEPTYGLDNLAIPESLARQDYWYRDELTVPAGFEGRTFTLTFKGVNYAAEVWLNGQRLGEIRGAFVRGIFDVTGVLRPGQPNALVARVSPVPHPGIPHEESLKAGAGPNGGAMLFDGPTFFSTEGWDWIPGIRDRCTGIWQDVVLHVERPGHDRRRPGEDGPAPAGHVASRRVRLGGAREPRAVVLEGRPAGRDRGRLVREADRPLRRRDGPGGAAPRRARVAARPEPAPVVAERLRQARAVPDEPHGSRWRGAGGGHAHRPLRHPGDHLRAVAPGRERPAETLRVLSHGGRGAGDRRQAARLAPPDRGRLDADPRLRRGGVALPRAERATPPRRRSWSSRSTASAWSRRAATGGSTRP